MSLKPVRRLIIALSVFALSVPAASSWAQGGTPDLRGALTQLFGGKDKALQPAPAPAGKQDDQPLRRVPLGQGQMELSFAPLVKKTAPAVVNVYASSRVHVRSPFMNDPFFEKFFGQQMPPRVQASLGSGVIVDPSGIIVTNDHVVQGADEVKVALADGREFESKILLKDARVDLAVLKIESKEPFPVVPLGDSDALDVGDLVLAIGNPFGVGQTTTSGIVSALARTHIGVSDFGFYIQTDAAINPGNSGGALINMQGQLVGINSAIYSQSGGSVGIGFAIPSNMVRAFVASAKNGSGFFETPYLGAQFQDLDVQEANALGLDRPKGALVSSVTDGTPAAKAGLKVGDVVLSLNGTPVSDSNALNYRISTQPIGSTATLEIFRSGAKQSLQVKLERAPEGQSSTELAITGDSPFAGTKVAALSPRLAERLGMPTNSAGVVVAEVSPNSPADNIGFQPKDIVKEVNGTAIGSAEDLQKAASAKSRWWRFTVVRAGQTIRQVIRY